MLKGTKFILFSFSVFMLSQLSSCSTQKLSESTPPAVSSMLPSLYSDNSKAQTFKTQNGFELIDMKYTYNKLDFPGDIQLSKDEQLYIFDCTEKEILYAIAHTVEIGANSYHVTDELCVWNIDSGRNISRIKVNSQNSKISVISARLSNDDILYSSTDWSIPATDKRIWEINLVHNEKIQSLDKGLCRNALDTYLPRLYKSNHSINYAYETIDVNNDYIFGAKAVSNGKVIDLSKQPGRLSENDPYRLLSCEAASNGKDFVYFIEKGKDAIFYLVGEQKGLQQIPLKGQIYTYTLLKDSLFQSAVENGNQENQMYKIYIDSLDGKNLCDVNAYSEFYRLESNRDNMLLGVNSGYDIFALGIKNGKVFRSKIDIPEYHGRPVAFFNVDLNSYYAFFTEERVLYKIDLNI